MRIVRSLVISLLVLPLGGCVFFAGGAAAGAAAGAATASTTRDATPGGHRMGSAVVVDFTSPRDLVAPRLDRDDTVRVAGVTTLTARVHDVRGDTLLLTVSEMYANARGRVPFGRGREPVLALVPAASTKVRTLAGNASLAERTVVGAGLGLLAGLLALVLYCRRGGGCLN